jgi:sugar phosphate isomerase/epimerase
MDTSRISLPALALSRHLRPALGRVRALGARGVEVDARGGLQPEEVSQTGRRQIRKWLDDAGLVVSAVVFRTRGSYAEADRLEGRIAATRSALELAHALGAAVVLNHVGTIPPSSDGAEEAGDAGFRLLVDVLSDVGAYGLRVGATLCAEAGRNGPDDLLRLVAALPEGTISCDLVSGALLVHGHDPVAAAEKLAPHLGYVHLTDAVAGPYAGRGRAAALGSGHVDHAAVLATLEERGYRGWVGLEPADERDAEAELAAAVALLGRL